MNTQKIISLIYRMVVAVKSMYGEDMRVIKHAEETPLGGCFLVVSSKGKEYILAMTPINTPPQPQKVDKMSPFLSGQR